jgi:hypothetical protein
MVIDNLIGRNKLQANWFVAKWCFLFLKNHFVQEIWQFINNTVECVKLDCPYEVAWLKTLIYKYLRFSCASHFSSKNRGV